MQKQWRVIQFTILWLYLEADWDLSGKPTEIKRKKFQRLQWLESVAKSQNHTECYRLEGTSVGHPIQPPAEAGSPTASCTGPCPGGSRLLPCGKPLLQGLPLLQHWSGGNGEEKCKTKVRWELQQLLLFLPAGSSGLGWRLQRASDWFLLEGRVWAGDHRHSDMERGFPGGQARW